MMNVKMSKREKIILMTLFFAALAEQLIYIMTQLDADTAYALTMSYRMEQGDKMFIDMWEPHQTSAFLLAALMRIYIGITGTNTGIVLFANIAGVCINCLIVFAVYRVFMRKMDSVLLGIMCLFLLVVRPKQYVLPEFSNMQVWFSILLFLCLIQYFDNTTKRFWLFLSSIFLCLEIISYPTCIIAYFGVCVVILMYSEGRWRDILLLSLSCFIQGALYLGYFIIQLGFTELMTYISYVITGDSAHKMSGLKITFFYSFGKSLIWLLVCFAVATILAYVTLLIENHKKGSIHKKQSMYRIFSWFSFVVFISNFMNATWLRNKDVHMWLIYSGCYLVVFWAARKGLPYCSAQEKRQVMIGYIISVSSLAAVLILTNLDFLCSLNYMILALMVSFVPIARLTERKTDSLSRLKRYRMIILFVISLAVNSGAILLDCGGIIKSGPAAGIITRYMDAYKINASMEEWKEYVHPGDCILLSGNGGFNTLGYMYEDTVISMPSVMCDPTYDDILLKYWANQPERFPDVIAVQSWYGELDLDEDTWMMQWIEENYQPSTYEDTDFWRFYRLDY